MCSYKVVKVFFEVWGLQGKVESGVHKVSENLGRGYNLKKDQEIQALSVSREIC